MDAQDTGFGFLERKFLEIISKKPFADYSKEQKFDNLDLIWSVLELEYFRNFKTKGDLQQSWNNNNGYFYEKVVLDYLNSSLKGKGISIYNMGNREHYKMPPEVEKNIGLTKKVTIIRRCLNQRYELKSDVELDLLAIDDQTCKIICSITCKTRYRERVYQPLYASKHLTNIRSVFVTMDRDKNLKTCENPSDKRALLEANMDMVFVNSSNETLGFCAMVRPFRDIIPVLLDWKKQQ